MSRQPAQGVARDVSSRTIRHMLLGFGLAATLWALFYAVWAAFPLIRPGNTQIYDEKLAMVESAPIFAPEAPVKLVISGNSRILSGFKPEVFRARSGGRISAFNLGLPNASHFIDELETLVARGEAPTHVFLTVPWATEPKPAGYARILDDDALMDVFFPFRRLVRDATLFAIRAASRGGVVAYYRKGQEYQDAMRAARGYFFIEGQSHFPNHQLPADFHLDSDDVSRPEPHDIRLEGPVFERLLALRRKVGFDVAYVPYYVRETASAPAASEPEIYAGLRALGIDVIDPAYWLYPNRLFSDPMHLNPAGADCYTHRLWEATRSILVPPDAIASDPGPGIDLGFCPPVERS